MTLKNILLLITITFCYNINAQTVVNSTNVNTYNTAPEGDLFIDENNDYYIGQQDGTLKILGNVKDITSLDDSIIISENNNVFDLSLSPTGGDNDSTNELQTLSKSGITTTLSDGGGSVTENVTSVSQSLSTGIITYTNESLVDQTANVVSASADNNITVGADGGAYKAFRVIDVYDNVGNQNIPTAPVKLTINTERTNFGGFAFDFNGDIRIPEDGIYEINYTVAFLNTSGGFNLTDVQSELRINGTVVNGSEIFTTHVTNPASSQTGSRNIILKFTAGDTVNIWSTIENGVGIIQSINSGSGLTIKKLY